MNRADQIPDGATALMDTKPIIYLFEGHPLATLFEPVFAAVDAGRIQALVTPVTLAEVLAGSLKAGKEALAERYRQTLCASNGWSLRAIDTNIAGQPGCAYAIGSGFLTRSRLQWPSTRAVTPW